MSEYIYMLTKQDDHTAIIGIYKTHDKAKEVADILYRSSIIHGRYKLKWQFMDDGNGYLVNNISMGISRSRFNMAYFIHRLKVED